MDTNGTPWEGELYETSRYNFIPEVRDQYNFREPVFIQDFTIVKMDHLEGTRLYSVEEYQEIARQLDEIGIPETVFLTDQYTGAPKETRVWEGVRGVTKLGLKIKVRTWGHFGTWAPGEYKSRIDKMADYGADSIGLSALLAEGPGAGEGQRGCRGAGGRAPGRHRLREEEGPSGMRGVRLRGRSRGLPNSDRAAEPLYRSGC